MEIAFLTATILLILFSLLAFYDGVYLHLYKYKLYLHPESRWEHATHTIRAALFPLLLYFLYLEPSRQSFYIGIAIVLLDVFTLTVDAYSEKDSRQFMGGLPRWEYILHLLVNGFHFASIAVWIIIKIRLTQNGVVIVENLPVTPTYQFFLWLVKNSIPGACLLALIHLVLLFPPITRKWARIWVRPK